MIACQRKAYPRAEAPVLGDVFERPKAKALGYLDAKAKTTRH